MFNYFLIIIPFTALLCQIKNLYCISFNFNGTLCHSFISITRGGTCKLSWFSMVMYHGKAAQHIPVQYVYRTCSPWLTVKFKQIIESYFMIVCVENDILNKVQGNETSFILLPKMMSLINSIF